MPCSLTGAITLLRYVIACVIDHNGGKHSSNAAISHFLLQYSKERTMFNCSSVATTTSYIG
jgi:hypothetical protein